MTRSVENRLARRYIRQDSCIAFLSLHGNYGAAMSYRDAPSRLLIEDLSDVIHSEIVKGELRLRFEACLLAERCIRRFGSIPQTERKAA